jgi:hypothetical protein
VPIICSESSVKSYQLTLRKNREERRILPHLCGSLKSRVKTIFQTTLPQPSSTNIPRPYPQTPLHSTKHDLGSWKALSTKPSTGKKFLFLKIRRLVVFTIPNWKCIWNETAEEGLQKSVAKLFGKDTFRSTRNWNVDSIKVDFWVTDFWERKWHWTSIGPFVLADFSAFIF